MPSSNHLSIRDGCNAFSINSYRITSIRCFTAHKSNSKIDDGFFDNLRHAIFSSNGIAYGFPVI